MTNLTEKRSPRLDLDGIGRRGFILQAAPDHDSPEKGLSAPETKRFLYSGDYKLIIVPVTSKQSYKLARITIAYSGNNHFSGKGRQC